MRVRGSSNYQDWGTAIALTVAVALAAPARAQVSTDGSVGAAQNFGSGNANIPASFGIAAGSNLFHSFSQFNVNPGATVVFSGPGEFANVVSRVTGGSSSVINGTLRSEIGSQGFYLFNPAGVLFGPNASIDVPAAFHVSDASAILMSDGGQFSVTAPGSDVLTSAAPAAFGFLGAGSGGITFQNAQVINDGQMSVSAAGGITAQNSLLLTDGADLRLQVPAAGGLFLFAETAPTPSPTRRPSTWTIPRPARWTGGFGSAAACSTPPPPTCLPSSSSPISRRTHAPVWRS